MPTGLAQNLSFILLGEDRTASKSMTAAQATAEKVTGRIGSAFSKLGGIIGGEFGQVLDQTGAGIEKLGSKGAKLSTTLEVGGAITAGAGVALMQLGSGAKQATDQLNQAIKNTGDSAEKYGGQVEKAVAKGQNFDHSAEDTKAALTKLIPAAGSTQKALDQMGVVTDLAAAKHISLADAASMVAKILSGSGAKTLTQYGITMEKAVDPSKALAAAQAGVTSASGALAGAQKRLADLQDIDHAKKKLTVSDHIALQNAQDAVTKASGKLAGAQTKLADTSTQVITKTKAGQDALDQLSKKLNGQASASVDNFGSQFDIVKTKVEDFVKDAAGPVGQTMTVLGPIFSVAGLAIDIYKTKQEQATIATIAQSVAATAATTATEAETTAQIALDGAMDANPIGLVALALGGLAAVVGGGMLLDGTLSNTKATADFTQALKDNTGATNDNIRAVATEALLKDGALKAGIKAGIAANILVDASLGIAGAQKKVNDELATYKQRQEDAFNAQANKNGQDILGVKYGQDYAHTIDLVQSAVGSVNQQYNTQVANQKLVAAGMDTTGISAALASGKVGALADQLGRLGAASPGSGVQISVNNQKVVKHAAGGTAVISKPTMFGSDELGESGPERLTITPLNSGRTGGTGSAGGDVHVNVTLSAGMMLGGSPQQQAQAIHGALVNLYRSGGARTELKHALGLV